jgi:hypothetical protein
MKRILLLIFVPLITFTLLIFTFNVRAESRLRSYFDNLITQHNHSLTEEGRETFRYSTFGDETWWGGQLHLHKAIEGSKFGGVGPGLSPAEALAAGLKVDVDALPKKLQEEIKHGKVNLNDPAVTLALLSLNSVVGVTGHFKSDGSLSSVGIQCALCHSTVDNSLVPGIGHRLDGWANRDLNVGAVVGLAPNLDPIADLLGVDVQTVQKVLASWGPGKFDAELFMDGKAFRPDGKSAATLIPPCIRLGRCEPAYLDRMGIGAVLECIRGKPGDARPRRFL